MARTKKKAPTTKVLGAALKGESTEESVKLFDPGHQFSMWDLLDYKALTDDKDGFIVLKAGGYAEILSVRGVGLGQLSQDGMVTIQEGFASFQRYVRTDIKWILMPFPVTTTKQQIFWGRKYKQYTDLLSTNLTKPKRLATERRQRRVANFITVSRNFENSLEGREYLLVIYSDNRRDLRQRIVDVYQARGTFLQLDKMTKERKQLMLYRLNNPLDQEHA